jgi:hypothetical protein
MKKLTFILVIITLSLNFVFSQTIIPDGTEVFGTWTKANSPYIINGEAIVPEDSTLIIEPGVEVKLKTGTNFDYESDDFDAGMIYVLGNIIAVGTESDSITFTRNNNEGFWGNLFFFLEQPDSSKMIYCNVSYGSKIRKLYNGNYEQKGAITVLAKNIEIRNNSILRNNYSGIQFQSTSSKISNNKIIHNENGILVNGSCNLEIINNVISTNSDKAIFNNGSSSLFIFGNIISYNKYGIYEYSENSESTISNNTIYGHNEFGIFKRSWFSHGNITHCYNNIVVNNGENIKSNDGSLYSDLRLLSVQNSLVGDSYFKNDIIDNGENIFGISPCFIDTIEFRLKGNSPAINSGTLNSIIGELFSEIDLLGNLRILNDSIDIGATEYEGDFLSITSPTDSEYFQVGKTEKITWNSNASDINIKYSIDNGASWIPIVNSTDNDGEYEWTVTGETSDSCLIIISDASNNLLTDTVDLKIAFENIIGNKELIYGIWGIEDSPYIIDGEATIPYDTSLTIEPGVVIKFKTGLENDYNTNTIDIGFMLVYGDLISTGTEMDSITFTRNGDEGNWGSIVFLNQTDTIKLDKCIFEYGNKVANIVPDGYFKTSYGALSFYRSNVLIKNSAFRNNKDRGLYIIRESNCILTQNKFYNNDIGAEIYLGSFGTDSTYNNSFFNNNIGLQINSGGNVFQNSFFNNSRAGILISYFSGKIYENQIFDNGYGVEGKAGGYLINNNIYQNNFGIYLYQEGTVKIISNVIHNNKNGIRVKSLWEIKVINNTIVNNKESGFNHYRCYNSSLKNNIHWNNNSEFVFDLGFDIQNSLIQDSIIPDGIIDLGGNILGNDPLFTDTLNNDFSLIAQSPCINLGNIDTTGLFIPFTDVVSNLRISNGRIDIGAYEYQDNADFVRILKPYYHEYLVSNLYYDLKWNLSDSLSNVKLIFSPDMGATWQNIVDNTENDGSYLWKVPEIFADSCLWAIVDINNSIISDTSTYYFSVSPNIIPDQCNYYGIFRKEYSPYQIMGKMNVPQDSVLIIEPGTEIKLKTGDDFEEDYRFDPRVNVAAIFVYGQILAEGEKDEIIKFTRLENEGNWGAIILDEHSEFKSSFKFCHIDYAKRYSVIIGNTNYSNNGAVNIYSDSTQILNTIVSNSDIGINVNHRAQGTVIKNCIISDNSGNGIDGYRGEIVNCTVNGNRGIGIYGIFDIHNSIIYNNLNSLVNRFNHNANNAKISYSLMEEESLPLHYADSGGVILNLSPQFVDPVQGNYHLAQNSPCIDTGNPADDFSDEPDPNGGRINMGAFGNTNEATSFLPLPRVDLLSAYQSSTLGYDTLTINGKYFLSLRGIGNVMFDNSEAIDYLKWNDSIIVCIIPAHAPGIIDLSITNNDDLTGIKKSFFTYVEPTIIMVDEQFGSTSGGKQIEISGRNFGEKQFNSSLFLGSELATQINSWSDSLIIILTPANTVGSKEIIFSSQTIQNITSNAFLYTENDIINVCGLASGKWTAPNIYIIDCDIEIPVDSVLIIEPGVLVIAGIQENPVTITVNGKLEVKGNETDSVFFTVIPGTSGKWGGIIVNKSANFEYANIQYAENGIRVKTTEFQISNSTLNYNSHSGIYFDGDERSASGKVNYSEFKYNETAIICEAFCYEKGGSASPEILNNVIHWNENDGIYCRGSGWVPSYGSISRSSSASPVINGNNISNNGGYAISCYASGDEAESYSGFLMKRYGNAKPTITNNIIYDNSSAISSVQYNYRSNADIVLTNNTFYSSGEIYSKGAKIEFQNSILWGEQHAVTAENYGFVTFDNCCLTGQGGTNIESDPLFLDESLNNFNLSQSSPCIDIGNNDYVNTDKDFDNKVRIWDGNEDDIFTVDIGAFEYGSVLETSPIILNQPVGGNFCEYSNVELKLYVIAFPEPVFQWFLNDTLINGADNETYTIYSLNVNETGIYTCKISNYLDSIVSEDAVVSLNPVYDYVIEENICEGDSFEIDGEFFISDTVIVENLSTIYGCDSIITNVITVIPEYSIAEDVEICEGESYNDWVQTGIYTDTLISIYGCNIIVTTNLTVFPTYKFIEDVSICEGEDYKGWTESGIFVDSLSSINGCDSVITTTLTVYPTYEYEEDISICEGETYKEWTQTGTYADTLTSINGCNIIINTNLTVNSTYEYVEDISICEGESYKGRTQSTTFIDSLSTINGCDSIITTNLTVNSIYDLIEDIFICEGEAYKGWIQTGTYVDSLSSIYGCDSIITTNLTVNPVYEFFEDIAICEGESYKGWTQTGTFSDTLESINSCDSIIVTNLTINPTYHFVIDAIICEGDSHKGWTTTGQYTENLISVYNCDSIVITNLIVVSAYESEEEIYICEGEEYLGLKISGKYERELVSVFGCDSIITTYLFVNGLPGKPIITPDGETLSCNEESEYMWYLNDNPITGAEFQNYTIEGSGYYQVSVGNESGCWSVRSDSVYVVKTNAIDFEGNNLNIYPNPTSGKVTIEGLSLSGTSTIKVYSSLGNVIYINEVSGILHEIDISEFASGMYHLEIIRNDQSYYFKVVKN